MGTVTKLDVCPRCNRPLPRAEYKPVESDFGAALFYGFIAFCLAMGFGLNGWLSLAVLLLSTVGVAIWITYNERRKFERRRAGL